MFVRELYTHPVSTLWAVSVSVKGMMALEDVGRFNLFVPYIDLSSNGFESMAVSRRTEMVLSLRFLFTTEGVIS